MRLIKRLLMMMLVAAVLVLPVFAADAPKVVKEGNRHINAKDRAEVVYIPAGEFTMGSKPGVGEYDEQPEHKVDLDGYWIYQTEVTVAQYRQFCQATGRSMPNAPPWGWKEDHPIVNVTWDDATAYAKWAGAALPTEAQWEKVARGTDGRVYPWGNTWPPPPGVGNFADETAKRTYTDWPIVFGYDDGYTQAAPVGRFPAGASPYGALDMAGNVWEWCADWYGPYTAAPAKNPTGPADGSYRVLRGGSWYYYIATDFRCADRNWYNPSYGNYYYGFRCIVLSPGP